MPVQNPQTLEEAREMLLQNSNTISQMQEQIDTLTGENTRKDGEIENLRTINQRYYLQIAQGSASENEPDPEPDPESLEDYARKMKGVILQ